MLEHLVKPPSDVKRIVCLANSRKKSGRCIAGKDITGDGRPGVWVRPVSDREAGEVSEYERQYEDGSDPRVLDVIDVPVLKAQPSDFQRENWLLDPEHYWTRIRRVTRNELTQFVDPVTPLWIDGYSSFNGRNDRVPLYEAKRLDSSLRLIRVDRLDVAVFQPGRDFGDYKRRVQGCFTHNNAEYRLWITDPVYERDYLRRADGDYEINESYLTVSLGDSYDGYCYKLIAAIIRP